MIKHSLKILQCSHRKIFKYVWPFLHILHERVKKESIQWNRKINNLLIYFVLAVMDLLYMECCKGCMVAMESVYYSNPFEFADALNNGTLTEDIIFPVLASISTEQMMGYYFVPFFKMPMLSVIVKRKTYSEIMTDLILSCLNLWPLLSICLMMALIAGFLMWIMVVLIAYIAWKVSIFGVFLVYIFPHLHQIRSDTSYLSVFSTNTRKYGPGKLQIRHSLHSFTWYLTHFSLVLHYI